MWFIHLHVSYNDLALKQGVQIIEFILNWCLTVFTFDSVQDGTTALYIAAQNGDFREVALLIAAKAQVDIQKEVRLDCSYIPLLVLVSYTGLLACY